jgi:UDP-glucuronate decarboxylase
MKKNVIVTGGAGFLGSHLCRSLISDGYYVIIIDNLSTGSLDNIADLEPGTYKFYNHDVTKPFTFLNEWVSIDQIWNLASPASPPTYQIDKVGTFKTNILGAMYVLETARIYGAKVFQASTSEIYGDPLVHPQPESYLGNVNTIGPRSCYDESKRAVETLMTDYHNQYGVVVKIARIFNTYGPSNSKFDGRVVPNFINQALNSEPITIYGSGLQTRSFCYVSDLIRGFRLLMDNTPDDFHSPVNLGNPTEFTMLEFADKILKITNSKSKIVFEPLPIDDPKQRNPDISLAKKILGWSPEVNIDDGLLKTIDYYKSIS